jgi:hypothetical protein
MALINAYGRKKTLFDKILQTLHNEYMFRGFYE